MFIFKFPDGSTVEKDFLPTDKVSTVKDAISKEIAMPPSSIRLLVHGHVMKDESHMSDHRIKEDDAIYVTGTSSADKSRFLQQKETQKPPVSLQDNVGKNVLDTEKLFSVDMPMFKPLLGNKEFIKKIISTNPQIIKMSEQNPEFKKILRSPEYMDEIIKIMTDKNYLNETLRSNDQLVNNLSTFPEGFKALASTYKIMQEPLYDILESFEDNSDVERKEVAEKKYEEKPMPNPWSSAANDQQQGNGAANWPFPGNENIVESFEDFFNFQGKKGNVNTKIESSAPAKIHQPSEKDKKTPTPKPPIDKKEITEKYSEQLSELREMGFTDDDLNIQALISASGDIDAAVNFILEKLELDS